MTFSYAAGAPKAVESVSFRIRQGDYTAFVGPWRCGKSTLYRLLLGFERPDAGTVFLDGHSVASLDIHSVRRWLGVVLQHGRVTAGRIYEKIAGIAEVSMQEAWAAARAAALEDDIRAMPMGMHTRLPDGGAGLSAGQKQAPADRPGAGAQAARASVRRSDERARQPVAGRRAGFAQGRRRDAAGDRPPVELHPARRPHPRGLQNGRIVESGGHDELMSRDGMFAALARRQLVDSGD